jgi:hypothetical protein
MGRAIGAVVLGYLTMVVIVFACLTGAYFALGADGAFQPGTYDVTPTWVVVWLVVSFAAAIGGGSVCMSIGKKPKTAYVLAAAVFVIGVLSALPMYLTPMEQKERTGDVGTVEAMTTARPPWWIPMMNPLIAAFGALVGARMKRVG